MVRKHAQVTTQLVMEQIRKSGLIPPYLRDFPLCHLFPTAYAHPIISVKSVNWGHMPMTPTMSCWSCGDPLWVPLNHSLTQGSLLLVFLLLWNKPGKTVSAWDACSLLASSFWWQLVITKLTNSLLHSCPFPVDVQCWGQLSKANEMRTTEKN